MTGDWYFKEPEGLDANSQPTSDRSLVKFWRYTLPGTLLNGAGEATWTVGREADYSDLSKGC